MPTQNVVSEVLNDGPVFPDLESEVCNVFNATAVALDYVESKLLAALPHDDACVAAYILHDAANRAAILKRKFYAAQKAHYSRRTA